MQTIAVVDYGMGNLRSVVNALVFVGGDRRRVELTADPERIAAADRVVFPGQGAARDCMRAIEAGGLREAVLEAAAGKPFLGICMGMQVLIAHSEENGGTDCLGLLAGTVRYFGDAHRDADGSRFYFVHSYYFDADDAGLTAGRTNYGFDFTSVIARDNLFALQCHPEKSADAGLQLLRNFIDWDGQA